MAAHLEGSTDCLELFPAGCCHLDIKKKKAIKVKGKWDDGKLNVCKTGQFFEFPNSLHNKNA